MTPVQRPVVRIFLLVLLFAFQASCRQQGPRGAPATTTERSASPAEASNKGDDQQAADVRKHARIQRDLTIARQAVVKVGMSSEHSATQHQGNVDRAREELELQRRRFDAFMNHSAPNRIAQAELDLRRAEDHVKEDEEELRQLEMMYAEEDFADRTKEIVLDRGRRRLERSQRGLELRRVEFEILKNSTIPIEADEHKSKLEQLTQALEKAQRDEQAARLDETISRMKAEAEVQRLEEELDALHEEIDRRRRGNEESPESSGR